MSELAAIFAADVGNTRLKLGRVLAHENVELAAVFSTAGPWPLSLPDIPRGASLAVACVAPRTAPRVAAWWHRVSGGGTAGFLGRDFPFALRLDYETPATLGSDRVAAATGAWALLGSSAIVLSAGSTITLDWLDEVGTFRGGAIAPGLRVWSSSLKRAAPALDWDVIDSHAPWPGRSSEGSCRVGLGLGALGYVGGLVRRAREVVGAEVPLLVTGGDAERVACFLEPLQPRVVDHLVLRGIACSVSAR